MVLQINSKSSLHYSRTFGFDRIFVFGIHKIHLLSFIDTIGMALVNAFVESNHREQRTLLVQPGLRIINDACFIGAFIHNPLNLSILYVCCMNWSIHRNSFYI